MSFDVAIVGAGSAGCVLAHRLTTEAKRKVVLIEAGPAKHHTLKVRAPGMYNTLWRSPLDWSFYTEPQQHCDDRRMFWPRGKVIGGTNCFNALVYIRGHRDNYDEWARLGNPGWGYADVLPYFKKAERNARGASEFHGADGPLHVGDPQPGVAARAFIEATAARCKVPVTDDFNGPEQEGAGVYQTNVRDGQRVSTATSYLDPIRGRENLTVIPNALALGLVLAGDRATGVRVRLPAGEQTIEAQEIIVCGGAIGSPHLLMLSGIGDGAELRAAGVDPRHELPGVGKHLEDHLLAFLVHTTVPGAVAKLAKLTLGWWAMQHLVANRGPLASSPVEAGAFVRHDAAAPRPDNQFHFVPYGTVPPNTDRARPLPLGRMTSMLPGLIYPRSHGTVALRSADPAEAPAIDPRYLSDPADLEHLVAGLRLAREIAATAPLAALLADETMPGPAVNTDDELRAYVRASVNTIFHPTGTCKMGTDAAAVVDPELRVRGLSNLRVADASIMPRIIGGNTNAPTIMIAEKCADLVG